MSIIPQCMGEGLQPYPVGSIYMSVNSTSPTKIFGGTWEQIKGRFLLAVDDTVNQTSKQIGGESSHILTIDEIPSHNHTANGVAIKQGYQSSSTNDYFTMRSVNRTNITGSVEAVTEVGGSQPHNNMPPYFTVYIWYRTS